MATEKILYTDENEVVVTESSLRVRSHSYRLDGILRHSFSIIKPNRFPSLSLIGLGLIALAVSTSGNYKLSNLTIQISSIVLDSKIIFSICGTVLILVGIVSAIALKEKYGVHIVTKQGEKDVLVSEKREYISKIVEALNHAFINVLSNTGLTEQNTSRPGMSVSHR